MQSLPIGQVDCQALAGFFEWVVLIADRSGAALIQTLDLCQGNKSQAARTLGISEKSIYNKMKRFGLS